MKFAYFGSGHISPFVLEELEKANLLPSLIITSPDSPKGRKMVMMAPEEKMWAEKRNVPVFQPVSLRDNEVIQKLSNENWDFFVIASYGKIIPKRVLDIPRLGAINIHPSLLPKLRGPAPMIYQILNDDRDSGVTLILLDEEVDHGPIIASKKVTLDPWPPHYSLLKERLGREGGKLLAETIPNFVEGKIIGEEQDHSKATFTKKISKEEGLLDLSNDSSLDEAEKQRHSYKNFLKIRAFEESPGTYFFVKRQGKEIRVGVKDAKYEDGQLKITRVVPEGKKEMGYQDFIRGMPKE